MILFMSDNIDIIDWYAVGLDPIPTADFLVFIRSLPLARRWQTGERGFLPRKSNLFATGIKL